MANARVGPLRGALGRGDLLLYLASQEGSGRDLPGGEWCGYASADEEPSIPLEPRPDSGPSSDPAPVPIDGAGVSPQREPLQLRSMLAVVGHELIDGLEGDGLDSADGPRVEPLTLEELRPRPEKARSQFTRLVPRSRLLPAVERVLRQDAPGPLDLPAWIEELSRGVLPKRLPRRKRSRWELGTFVLLDLSAPLACYQEDMHGLAEDLRSLYGKAGVGIWVSDRAPDGRWERWRAAQAWRRRQTRPWQAAAPGTPVLIASDLGTFDGEASRRAQRWRQRIDEMFRRGLQPVVLAPISPFQVPEAWARRLPFLRWSPDSAMRPDRRPSTNVSGEENLLDLLAAVSVLREVSPRLLRELRCALVPGPGDAGLEGRLAAHPGVECTQVGLRLREGAAQAYNERFGGFTEARQGAVHRLAEQAHRHLSSALQGEEALALLARAKTKLAVQVVTRGEEHLARVIAALEQPSGQESIAKFVRLAAGLLRRADPALARREPSWRRLASLVADWQDRLHQPRSMASWVEPAVLSSPSGPACELWLVEDLADGTVRLQKNAPGPGLIPLYAEPIMADARGVRIDQGEGLRTRTRWLLPDEAGLVLCRLDEDPQLTLTTAFEAMSLKRIMRPRGLAGWSREGGWLHLESPPFAGTAGRRRSHVAGPSFVDSLLFGKLTELEHEVWIDVGFEPEYGLAARLNVIDPQRDQVHDVRFRWIEPCTFWMGSPEEEPERESDEGPRHRVTLTEGFWMAETACTQALWTAVMGENPSSGVRDPEHPVTDVSWHDAMAFVGKLNRRVARLGASLPTEAEWECACRAGTTTPFSFGTQVSTKVVNYDGSYPYDGGAQGEYRQATVKADSFRPNAWGLMQMHGNVDEWCLDGMRKYDRRPSVDPGLVSTLGGADSRAVRGGSWFNFGRGCRSAFRYAASPSFRDDLLGFRLCLRSMPGRPGGWNAEIQGGTLQMGDDARGGHESL